ncbi:MAG TPA: galactokinase [Clostridiales bacterium]|nr:galactokinase [Clostridiales bacterium]
MHEENFSFQNIHAQLESTETKDLFAKLYGGKEQTVRTQITRYQKLIETYQEQFPDASAPIHLFSTPGRTEVGGNHTDHNAGHVLAAAVHFDTIATAEKTRDNKITICSEGYPEVFQADLSTLEPIPEEKETTTALIRGIAARFRQLGFSIGGFRAYVASSVARGSGLSSSASIEVLLGTILNALYNDDRLAPALLAVVGQYAENIFFGKPCGLMDQMACAVGGFITIDFKDNEKPAIRKINFDPAAHGYHMLVVDTGGNHADLTQDYADVPREMKQVAEALGKKVLRELTMEELIENIPTLRKKVGDRAILRAMHFFGDDQRVVRQARALEEDRFRDFLDMVNESGSSSWRFLQNCYSNQNPQEQGVPLALAVTENFIRQKGEGACRVHGGGFAGTIQVYLPDSCLAEYVEQMEKIFGDKAVTILNVRPFGTLHLNPYWNE